MTEGEHHQEERDDDERYVEYEFGDLVESTLTIFHGIDECLDTYQSGSDRKSE